MYSIDKKYINEIIIEKSKFICILYPINNIDEIKQILENITNEYKAATHYCYAYITGNAQKYSDDGEPSGTAGAPMLNVLKNKNLENILAIVIRYFGGIKLGSGGLVRAYTRAVSDCINVSNIIKKELGLILNLSVTYENLNLLYNIIDEKNIIEKTFDENISLNIKISIENYELIKDKLNQICIYVKEKESIFV